MFFFTFVKLKMENTSNSSPLSKLVQLVDSGMIDTESSSFLNALKVRPDAKIYKVTYDRNTQNVITKNDKKEDK